MVPPRQCRQTVRASRPRPRGGRGPSRTVRPQRRPAGASAGRRCMPRPTRRPASRRRTTAHCPGSRRGCESGEGPDQTHRRHGGCQSAAVGRCPFHEGSDGFELLPGRVVIHVQHSRGRKSCVNPGVRVVEQIRSVSLPRVWVSQLASGGTWSQVFRVWTSTQPVPWGSASKEIPNPTLTGRGGVS